jgi:hypothetical protein
MKKTVITRRESSDGMGKRITHMRRIMSFTIAAVALLAGGPALAQNETDQANAIEAANMVNNTAVANDVAVAPAPEATPAPVDTTVADTTAPAPAERRSFPWGVLGLLGLVGLLGRKRA